MAQEQSTLVQVADSIAKSSQPNLPRVHQKIASPDTFLSALIRPNPHLPIHRALSLLLLSPQARSFLRRNKLETHLSATVSSTQWRSSSRAKRPPRRARPPAHKSLASLSSQHNSHNAR